MNSILKSVLLINITNNVAAVPVVSQFGYGFRMKFFTLGWLFLVTKVLLFQQNEYKVIFERMEVVSHDTTYADVATTHNYKYNRTQALVNLTLSLTQYMGYEVQLEVQAYKLASNEYRLFPLRFMFDFCTYVARNEFGLGELFHCGNITACPLTKGVWNMCMWKPNSDKFPPHIPKGSYMLDLKLFYHDIQFLFLQLYVTVKYPEVKGYPFF